MIDVFGFCLEPAFDALFADQIKLIELKNTRKNSQRAQGYREIINSIHVDISLFDIFHPCTEFFD